MTYRYATVISAVVLSACTKSKLLASPPESSQPVKVTVLLSSTFSSSYVAVALSAFNETLAPKSEPLRDP